MAYFKRAEFWHRTGARQLIPLPYLKNLASCSAGVSFVAFVEYLFATNVEDPGLRRQVDDVKQTIYEKLRHQFKLIEPIQTTITTTERRVRERAFSDAVRKEYDYSCAVHCQCYVEITLAPERCWSTLET